MEICARSSIAQMSASEIMEEIPDHSPLSIRPNA